MSKYKVVPNDIENVMRDSDFIVSKTDLKGKITYGNRTFIEFSKYSEAEMLGKPHSMVRHPDMPRAVFRLLWEKIQNKKEVFAYVKNLSADGSYYWVLANVTPVLNEKGEVAGYSSVRRKPKSESLDFIKSLYSQLLNEEKKHKKGEEEIKASTDFLNDFLETKGVSYDKFILSI